MTIHFEIHIYIYIIYTSVLNVISFCKIVDYLVLDLPFKLSSIRYCIRTVSVLEQVLKFRRIRIFNLKLILRNSIYLIQ